MDRKIVEGKVSVIIPVYNGAAWIKECMESVLSQTWSNFELLVLDDHSTDGTTQIIQEMSQKDQRIQLILRKGRGVSAARNQGIEQSNGEYVTFLDGDDKLDEKMLERLIKCLQEENSDMVSCGYYRWTSNFEMAQGHRQEEQKYIVKTVNEESYVSDYLLHQHTHCWGILYKRSAIGKVKFREDLTIGEDMMFLVDLLPQLSKISIMDYKGYYYRINETGVTLRPFVPAYMDEIRSWLMAVDLIGKNYSKCLPQAKSILAVSGVLVAGKIALLSRGDRKKYWNYIQECRRIVMEALKMPGARKKLPPGYGVKVRVFVCCPRIYLELYHFWKSR